MTYIRILFLVFFLQWGSQIYSVSRTIDNPQAYMVGARQMSLGGTNPALDGDIGGLLINPGILGTVDLMPFSVSSQKLLNAFDYTLITGSLPFNLTLPFVIDGHYHVQRIVFGVSYGTIGLSSIPQTILDGNVIRQYDSYSAGFQLLHGSAGTVFFDIFGFNQIAAGAGLKYLSYSVDGENSGALGVDLGLVGTYDFGQFGIDRAHLGLSVLNILSTPFQINDGTTSFLPIEFYLGGRLDMWDDKLSLFAHNSLTNLTFGAEYLLGPGFYVRGSTDLSRINVGTGLVFGNVMGFSGQPYDLRFDYNLTMNQKPFDQEFSHAISLTITGGTQLGSPRIVKPLRSFTTSNPNLTVSGLGPKDTEIRLYDNGVYVKAVQSNRYGKWSVPGVVLREGNNVLSAEAISLDKEYSEKSPTISVILDTVPPQLDVAVFPEQEELVTVVLASSDTTEILGLIEGIPIAFSRVSDGTWEGRLPLPAELSDGASVPTGFYTIQIAGRDEAGNESIVKKMPFFLTMTFPPDKYVHEKENLRLLGTATAMVKDIKIGNDRVYIDANKKFSMLRKLGLGKNAIPITYRTLNDEEHFYKMRVLHLASFSDLEGVKGKRAIELMATLGVIFGDADGKFNPQAPVTRKYMARLMVKAAGLTVAAKSTVAFPDISPTDPDAPYIDAAIENGLMVANPDGTFRPNDTLTMSEAMTFLNSAGIAQDEEGTVRRPGPVTRAELAVELSYQPKYEEQIADLVNFETGY